MSPRVSVIIPAYNTEAYIEKAIVSVLNQTLSAVEVVVVDDGSSDRTVEVVRAIADERVRLFINEQNLGASGARNRALQESRGEWVAVLDADDWYAPDRLDTLLQLAIAEGADMVADDLSLIQDNATQPWSTLIRESGQTVQGTPVIDPVFFVETDVYGQPSLHLGLAKPVFKRDFLLRHQLSYDTTFKVTHDFWLYLACLIRGARFVLLPKPYYYYRSRPGSLVGGSQIRRLEDDLRATAQYLQWPEVQQNPALTQALIRNRREYRKGSAYYHVVEPLKARRLGLALAEMGRHPSFFVEFARRLPNIFAERLGGGGGRSATTCLTQEAEGLLQTR